MIGTGGYASAPVVKMAQKMHIPTYIHEQNAFPGVTNKMLEKHVEKVFLGFEEGSEYFRYPEKHVATGNPVEKAFMGWTGSRRERIWDLERRILCCLLLAEVRAQGGSIRL